MKCQTCGGRATVHISEVRDGQIAASHLCWDHAASAIPQADPKWRGDAKMGFESWLDAFNRQRGWYGFLLWLWRYVRDKQTLPPLEEVARQGEIGRAVARATAVRTPGPPPTA